MFAAIDIGTNTVLLLIAKCDGSSFEVIHEEQRIPRLGKGVDKNHNLAKDSIDRVIEALREYRRIITYYYSDVKQTMVIATSAVRDSSNKEEFKSRVEKETGFTIHVLSGLEEAKWTYRGARSMLGPEVGDTVITLDIGGGSTEVSLGINDKLTNYHSFDIGSVRFTERYIHSDPPRQEEIEACRKAIKEAFSANRFDWKGEADAVGIAGTVTSLAYMQSELTAYEPKKLAGMKMTTEQVRWWIDKISEMKTTELIDRYPVVMEGRADVFLPGILILEEFLKEYNFDQFIVSTGGIRHGGILKLSQGIK